jgi:hypothetical protein
MRKAAAYLGMLGVVLVLAGADLLVLTSTESLSRFAEDELRKLFGARLSWSSVRATRDGVVALEGARYPLGEKVTTLEEAGRVEIRLRGGLLGKGIDQVTFRDVRLRFSDRLIEDLGGKESKGTIRDVFPDPSDLPRLVCRGGTVEAVLPAAFDGGRPQVMELRELSATPIGGYRVHVDGSFSSRLWGTWRVTGEADLESGAVSLSVESKDLALGPGMREALAPALRDIHDKYRPGGRCDLRVALEKQPGRDLEVRTTLLARDMTITYRNFPYAVDRVQGEIEFTLRGFRVKHMTGRHGPATIRFDGAAEGYESEAAYAFRLDLEDVPLDADLRAAVDEEGRRVWDQFQPKGRVRVHGLALRDAGPDKPGRIPLRIRLEQGSFRFDKFPYDVRNVSGDLDFEGADVSIQRLAACEGGMKLEIAGAIRGITGDAELDLGIDVQAFPLDARLRAAFPEAPRKTWDLFGPSGIVDGRVELRKERGKELVPTARIKARGNAATYAKIPVPVSELEGDFELLEGGGVSLHHLSGKARGGRVHLHGLVKDELVDLEIEGRSIPVDEELKKAMPEEVARLLRELRLTGTAGFRCGLRLPSAGERRFTLDLRLSKGVVDIEPRFEDLEGHAVIEGFLNEPLQVRGPLRFSTATVMGKRLTDLSATMTVNGPTLLFEGIKAQAYGGIVAGKSFGIDLGSKDYSGELFTIDRLDLSEYAKDTSGFAGKALAGKAMLEVRDLRGTAGNGDSVTGRGRLLIQEAVLWDIPVFLSLFKMNPQDLFKAQNRFDAGTIDFDIRQRKFDVRNLVFSSESVSLVGRGRVNFDGEISLHLKARSGPILGIDILPVRLLTGLWDLLTGFVGVTVGGTWEKPEIK